MSSEVIVAPDVEAVVIDYLEPLLGIPGSSNVPSPRPDAFFTVEVVSSVSGFSGVVLYEAVVGLKFWNTSRTGASLHARRAMAYLSAAYAFYAEPGGYGWLGDPDSGTPLYVLTPTIYIRGSVL